VVRGCSPDRYSHIIGETAGLEDNPQDAIVVDVALE
jgi:hypothetical protein